MWPTTLRSSHTVYATAVSSTIRTITDLITDTSMKAPTDNAVASSPKADSPKADSQKKISLPQLQQA
jgi:hypothetical protein